MPREREQTRVEMLYARYHELLLESEKIEAKIATELHDSGIAHSLHTLVRAKFVADHGVLHETLAAATKAYQLEVLHLDRVRDSYYKTMADSAQISIDRELEYKKGLEGLEQFKELVTKKVEERKEDEPPKEGP